MALNSVDGAIAGERPETPVILCHDRRERKDRLINLALDLHRNGFPVLLFDFRGHGNSQTAASTYGVHEKRDLLAAIDLLQERLPAARRIGVYGVGMRGPRRRFWQPGIDLN